jgi:peptidoglycan/LPS O-acetylase OafA/YrhL
MIGAMLIAETLDAGALTNSETTPRQRFNPGGSRNLDILRMIAVALVVQDHLFTYWHNPSYWHGNIIPQRLGRFGVVLFFVHTALVLMASMERQWQKTGRHRFVSIFLIRRGFRIYPLALAALLITVAFNIPGQISVHNVRHVPHDGWNLVANVFLVQNFAGGEATSILSPMWSLAFEWQMYLVLPIFYFLCRRASNLMPLLLIWSIPVLWAISYDAKINQWNNKHHFWQIPDWGIYAPCFIAGIIAFFVAYKLKPDPVLPWFALPLVIAALFLPMMANGGVGKFMPASIVIAMTIPYCREIRHGWFSEAARIIVRYSYGIYLFHMFGIWMAFVKLHDQTRTIQWLVFAAIVAAVPVVFYHLLEHPAIVLGNRIAKRIEPRTTSSPAAETPPP